MLQAVETVETVETAETALETAETAKPVAAKPVAAKPATQFKLGERLTLPCVVTREEAKELARKLWSNDASAFAGVSTVATNDNLASKVVSLALSKMVFGEHSRLDRAERYASTLPDYKKTKSGVISGAIGKRLILLREAVSIGSALRTTILNVDSIGEFNLASIFGGSPVLSGMLSPPAKAKVAAEDPTVAAARAESLAKAEAERRAAEACAAEQASIVKLTMQEVQTGILSMGSSLDNEAAPQQYQIMRLETARALRIAEESARENAEQEYKYRQEGKTLVAKIHAFCGLASELGVKLTPAQLKILDALEYPTKVA
jgi:hypothetical protein